MRASGRALTVEELIMELGMSHLPANSPIVVRVEGESEDVEPVPAVSVDTALGGLMIEVESVVSPEEREDLGTLRVFVEGLANSRTAGGNLTAIAKRASAVLDQLSYEG